MEPVRVVGLGGSLRAESTSRSALEHAPTGRAQQFADTVHSSDALIWSSPTYHGSVSGAFKNALDWDPPYLSGKPIGLISTAGGSHGLQAVNTMDFIARSLRGWSVPLVMPVAQSWQSFDPAGHLKDESVAAGLRKLGAEVVRAARQFRASGTCDYAEDALPRAATAVTAESR